MAKNDNIEQSENKSITVQNKAEIAVRVVGATLNGDIKNLYKILQEHKEDDEISFLSLSGILRILSNKEERFESILQPIDGFYRPQKFINLFLVYFEKILNKRDYNKYNVALMPDSNISKGLFIEESILGILYGCLTEIFSGSFSRHKDQDIFIVSENVKLLFLISLGYGVVTKDFNEKSLKIVFEALDNVFTTYFSNSKSKVWDARKSSLEYFIKQLFIFNDLFDKQYQNRLFRRWKAWFLLEDKYKIENKKVVRKNLQSEMLYIFNNLH